jgi:hypothetical protein
LGEFLVYCLDLLPYPQHGEACGEKIRRQEQKWVEEEGKSSPGTQIFRNFTNEEL